MDPLAPAAALARIDAGDLAVLAARLRACVRQLRAVAGYLRAAPGALGRWSGAGHDSFVRAVTVAGEPLSQIGDTLEVSAVALTALATALQAVQAEVSTARGVLGAAGPTGRDPAVTAVLTEAVGRFRSADVRAATVLAQVMLLDLTRGSLPPGAVASLPFEAGSLARDVAAAPPLPSGPAAVAVWWAGLAPATRAAAATHWPDWPGGLDGVPPVVRDAANRRRLAAALHDARIAYAGTSISKAYAHLAARARLIMLQSLTAAVRPAGSQLLLFDSSGDGEAVISTADVQSCRAVAILVPGMSTELGDVPGLTQEARRLAAAAGPGTAAVAWLGYDAPDARQVASDGPAKSGAQALRRFVAGLRSTAARRQHVTVLGHSYGSLVAGLAAKGGLAADDLVLLASPGVDASRASELHLQAGHVWAARAPTDPIQLLFWPSKKGALFGLQLPTAFGPDPAAAPFGAKRFPEAGAFGHSGYFAPGSQSLKSLGRIVSGRFVP